MMFRSLACALALVFSMGVADARTCTTRTDLATFLAQKLPGAAVTVLVNQDAQLFLASLNALPPVTQLIADEVVLVDMGPRVPDFRIVLFENGCMTRLGTLARGVARKLLNDVGRAGA